MDDEYIYVVQHGDPVYDENEDEFFMTATFFEVEEAHQWVIEHGGVVTRYEILNPTIVEFHTQVITHLGE